MAVGACLVDARNSTGFSSKSNVSRFMLYHQLNDLILKDRVYIYADVVNIPFVIEPARALGGPVADDPTTSHGVVSELKVVYHANIIAISLYTSSHFDIIHYAIKNYGESVSVYEEKEGEGECSMVL